MVLGSYSAILFEAASKKHLQAALTGESLPVTLYEGDKTLMGSTVVRGETEGTVEYTGVDTFFGKTAALLASTEDSLHGIPKS